ncbi:MAG TPA: DUF1634 domain-containing protein [Terriglobales bacterium]|nr:DUF1634 domain-containing protein [Terriglobales bacterium]
MNRDVAADHALALTLKAGAYSAFGLIVAGLICSAIIGSRAHIITKIGVLVLLATPALRLMVAAIQFLRERDKKFFFISIGVLSVVALAFFLGVQV